MTRFLRAVAAFFLIASLVAINLPSLAVARGGGGGGHGGGHSAGHSSGHSHSSGGHSHSGGSYRTSARSHNTSGLVHVRGYYRSNGTYVASHTRGYAGSGGAVRGYAGGTAGAGDSYDDDAETAADEQPAPLYRTKARTGARTAVASATRTNLLAAKYIAVMASHKHLPIVSYEDEGDGYRFEFANGGHGHYPSEMVDRFEPVTQIDGDAAAQTFYSGQDSPASSTNSAAPSAKAMTVLRPVAPALQAERDEMVYVTKTGKKYHRAGCRSLSKSQIPMQLSEARKQFGPCANCQPPD